MVEVAQAGGVPEALSVHETPEPSVEDQDIFYQAWLDELLSGAMQTLLTNLYAEGRGDYFRALYGRVCEELSAAKIATALDVSPAAVENYLRVAKTRLATVLQSAVRQHVERYTPPAEVDAAFRSEWSKLGNHLERFGGLEAALQREAASSDRLPANVQHSKSFVALSKQ